MSETTQTTQMICHKCKKPLTTITEEYEGFQHWDWNKEKQNFDTTDMPTDHAKFFCGKCGVKLNAEEQEWFEEKKA